MCMAVSQQIMSFHILYFYTQYAYFQNLERLICQIQSKPMENLTNIQNSAKNAAGPFPKNALGCNCQSWSLVVNHFSKSLLTLLYFTVRSCISQRAIANIHRSSKFKAISRTYTIITTGVQIARNVYMRGKCQRSVYMG